MSDPAWDSPGPAGTATVPTAERPAVVVRPLRPDEAQAAHLSSFSTFAELDARSGLSAPEHTPEVLRRGTARVAHRQRTDPHGAWAAELDGRLVGVALAVRREGLWFLSLLTVEPGLQGAGVGRRLLEAALGTAEDAAAGLVLSSADPKALRRYARAGFAPTPGYVARGPLDRALLPAVPSVRESSLDRDGELVEDVARSLRGAGFGPDLAFLQAFGARLLIADGPEGRGFAVLDGTRLRPLGATTTTAARALLWTALAESGPDVTVEFLTGGQQWAIDVVLAARLPLLPGSSVCTRGRLGPFTPYLPSGTIG